MKKPPQKVAYLWQLGGFFLCSPDCPKQPRLEYSIYRFLYPMICGGLLVILDPRALFALQWDIELENIDLIIQ